MVMCKWCNQEMTDNNVDSCNSNRLVEFPDGTKLPASTEHFNEPNGRCRDCNIKHGGYHHPGCCVERCPKCGNQLITCGCLNKGVIEEQKVNLIASGYEWNCPNCYSHNEEIENTETVECADCKKVFEVNDINHAHG